MRQKNNGIETLRVLISLVVVIGHVFQPGRFYPDVPGVSKTTWTIADFFISLGLPLFACISGYLYGLSKKGTQGVISDKVWRLLLPALGAVLLETVLRCLLAASPGPVKLIPQFLIVTPYTLWFLESLFLIFVIVVGLDRAGVLKTTQGLVGTFSVSTAVSLGWPALFNALEVRFQGVTGVAVLLPAFVAGIWFAREPRLWEGSPTRWAIALLALGTLTFLVSPGTLIRAGYSTATHAAVHALYTGAVALACPLAILFAPTVKVLAPLGAWSFGIYVYHNLFLNTIVSWGLTKFSITASMPILLGVSVLVTALAVLVQWTFQRVKVLNAFAGIKPKKTTLAGTSD